MLRQLAPSAGAGEAGGAASLRQLLRALDGRYPSSLDAAINAVLSKGTKEQQQQAALVGSQALQGALSEEAARGLQDCLRDALAGSMRQPLSASSQTMAVALDSPAAKMRILVSHRSLQALLLAHAQPCRVQQAGRDLPSACMCIGEDVCPVGQGPWFVVFSVCVRPAPVSWSALAPSGQVCRSSWAFHLSAQSRAELRTYSCCRL